VQKPLNHRGKPGGGKGDELTATVTTHERPVPQPVTLRVALLALLTAALWGANPVAVSFSVDALPPVAVAAIRFAMATAFMWVWCRIEGSDLRLHRHQIIPALIAGVLMFVQISTFNFGVVLSNSSHSSMLINTSIFWVVALEHFVTRHDQLNGRKLLGLIIAALGVTTILLTGQNQAPTTGSDEVTLAGDLILLSSAVVLALKLVYVKHSLRVIEPGKLIFWHNVVGLVFFTVYSLMFEEFAIGELTWAAVWGVIYQGIFVAGLCFAIQAVLLRHHSASQISVFGFATPLFGVGLGVLMRGDPFSANLLVAASCVAIGIVLVNVAPRDRTDSSDLADATDPI
jgi:drug/metabolite transporter (DMT)-like permease